MAKEANSALKVTAYSKKTSSTTLRKHLYSIHMKVWLSECKRHDITIIAKDALEAIAAFRGVAFESQTQPRPHLPQLTLLMLWQSLLWLQIRCGR